MTRSIDDAFAELMRRLTPSANEKSAAWGLRKEVQHLLGKRFAIEAMFETGSLRHGTAVSGHCDADYFAILKSPQPVQSDSALSAIRDSFGFPFKYFYVVKVRRPAVVIARSGGPRLEVVPAYRAGVSGEWDVFNIPAPGGNWMESSPRAHLSYVTHANERSPLGRAKSLARLLKAWKYKNGIPMSSFYIEMRAAEYVNNYGPQKKLIDIQSDFSFLMAELVEKELRPLIDPLCLGRGINACSSVESRSAALDAMRNGADAAIRAVRAELNGDDVDAFRTWKGIFGASFPGRYPWW